MAKGSPGDTASTELDEPALASSSVAASPGRGGRAPGWAEFAGTFVGKADDVKDACPSDRCPESARGLVDETQTLGNVSTIGFSVALVGAIAGTVLLLVSSGDSDGADAEGGGLTIDHRGVRVRF